MCAISKSANMNGLTCMMVSSLPSKRKSTGPGKVVVGLETRTLAISSNTATQEAQSAAPNSHRTQHKCDCIVSRGHMHSFMYSTSCSCSRSHHAVPTGLAYYLESQLCYHNVHSAAPSCFPQADSLVAAAAT